MKGHPQARTQRSKGARGKPRPKRADFAKKFNLKLKAGPKPKPRARAEPRIAAQAKKGARALSGFEYSGVLFLSKPGAKGGKKGRRKLVSVEISSERKDRHAASKTVDAGKKVFRRKIRKKLKLKLKLNLRQSFEAIFEVPTEDREARAVEAEAERWVGGEPVTAGL